MAVNENVNLNLNAKDRTRGVLSKVRNEIIKIGLAYKAWQIGKDFLVDSIAKASDYQATMASMRSVVAATGRDMNQVLGEMQSHMGGLADKTQVADGFLKGLTTKLTVNQISELTQSVKNASLAMGEDFGTQLPLIIKAVKQLNPAILDNIGVTVRLDEVNKRIRDGFYGVGTAINEATQQHAIFTEITKQTAIFQGQEEVALKTTKGAFAALSSSVTDLKVALGSMVLEGDTAVDMLNDLSESIKGLNTIMEAEAGFLDVLAYGYLKLTGRGIIAKGMVAAAQVALDAETEATNANAEAKRQQGEAWKLAHPELMGYLETMTRADEMTRANAISLAAWKMRSTRLFAPRR